MTIRVSVKNDDTRQEAKVLAFAADPETGLAIAGGKSVELHAGEACDIYVHSGQSIVVKEVECIPKQKASELALAEA